ncbi:hypothetical protein [Modestobacter versicolor]|uniref:Lipoprotein n=1 Tax=Modestobacter versicolor TaxID=429133 RepID=A0A839Y0L4_9ACTN|nr:hypothetical protein [Modestobacter versicolor]MBB3676319.1 hypothetical protein [Modestobacter versicolor]
MPAGRAWTAGGAALIAAATLALTGCASFGAAGDSDTLEASEQAAADLQDELAGMPGVTTAFVGYQDDLTEQAHLRVNVEVAEAAQVETTFPEVEEAAWLCEVDPLLTMKVTVVPVSGSGTSQDYDLQDQQTVDDLTERWGERP